MTAPRVPAGMTREAADLVWADWDAALAGGDQGPLCMASDIAPELCHALERAGCVSVWTYTRQDRPGEVYYIAAWKSVEARLRAWAAVGAPVLAPAEDGKASLTEWVAAAEGSALGRPMPGTADYGAAWALFFASATVTFLAHGAWVQHNGGEAVCATPAELRACLDRLAAEARP